MARKDIKIQAEIEREMLSHIENGLRTVLAWHTEGEDYSRKLSTLRFIAQSFERHLDRVQALDEHDGFIPMVLETKPHLKPRIEDLKSHRDEERARVQKIVSRLDRIPPDDMTQFNGLCDEMSRVLERYKAHRQQELALLQEAFTQEEGGGG